MTLARILDERPGTTGFVVQNESAVEPLPALLRQQGRAVPEDVSVVAVCPEQVAVQASVRLTSVAVPAQEMGRHAVEQLVAKLDGRGGDEVVLLLPELTVRASSGPAPVQRDHPSLPLRLRPASPGGAVLRDLPGALLAEPRATPRPAGPGGRASLPVREPWARPVREPRCSYSRRHRAGTLGGSQPVMDVCAWRQRYPAPLCVTLSPAL